MRYFFWICWSAELLLVLWLLYEDLQLEYMPVTPATYIGFLWLGACLLLRFGPGWKTLSNVMVGIPAFFIGLYGLFLLIVVTSGARWN